MKTVTITISPKTSRGKHLIALLQEMAREGNDIVFEDFSNTVTRKACKDVEAGKLIRVKNSRELFKELGI